MKLNFSNLSARTDKDKAIPVLEHVFQPLDDHPEIRVRCSYLKPGESLQYARTSADGIASIDFIGLFRAQVKGIEGLEVEYSDGKSARITTAEEFLQLPSAGVLSRLLTSTCTHLLNTDSLTEEEVKN